MVFWHEQSSTDGITVLIATNPIGWAEAEQLQESMPGERRHMRSRRRRQDRMALAEQDRDMGRRSTPPPAMLAVTRSATFLRLNGTT